MSGDDMVPRVESAVAAAAAASFLLLKPVPFEEDEIATALAWRTDVEQLDERIGARFPGVESLNRIVPCGDLRALWRYRFFELAVRPDRTDCRLLLRALETALSSKRAIGFDHFCDRGDGTDNDCPTLGVGHLLMGPLGVIGLPRPAWTGALECVHPTYNDWQNATTPASESDWDSIAAGELTGPTGSLHGWSECWRNWLLRLIWVGEHDGLVWIFNGPRIEWSPINASLSVSHQSLLRGLYESFFTDESRARQLLQACLRDCRADFFEGVDFEFASRARKALLDPQVLSDVGSAGLWQLLHIGKLELVLSTARELGFVSAPRPSKSFAENLAGALVEVSDRLGHCAVLEQFMGHAEGAKYDQVLHLILRQGEDIFSKLLIDGTLARALAQLTAAPIRFQSEKLDAWDRTSPQEQKVLAQSISEVLGREEVPSLNRDVFPVATASDPHDREQLRAKTTAGRIRSEYLLKTAVQYLYELINLGRCSDDGLSGWTSIHNLKHLESDTKLCEWASVHRPSIDLGHMTVSQLVSLHAHLCISVRHDAPKYLLEVKRMQTELVRYYEREHVARAGNLGPHLNSATLDDMSKAFDTLRSFDRFAQETTDILPGFVRFVREVREVNRPSVVTVEPISSIGIRVPAAKLQHFISHEGVLRALRGDRVYSFTDVTRNEISVNPIVIDWTDWVREIRELNG